MHVMLYFDTACADGDVRLLNETTDFNNSLGTYRGQVLVCVNGSFRPICDFGWDDNDAQVVCILRYGPRFGKKSIILHLVKVNHPLVYSW